MEQEHYTIEQVLALEDHFKSMIHSVITDMLHAGDPSCVNFVKEYNLLPGVTYTFIFKANPLSYIKSLDSNPIRPPNVATATTNIGNMPWAINFEQSDFESPVEDILRHPTVDLMIKLFITNVVTNMARSFYGIAMRAQVQSFIDNQNDDGLIEISEGMVNSVHGDWGYRVALSATDAEGKTEVLLDDYHFQKYPRGNALHTEKDICSRYTHDAFIFALGSGLLLKDQWSSSII